MLTAKESIVTNQRRETDINEGPGNETNEGPSTDSKEGPSAERRRRSPNEPTPQPGGARTTVVPDDQAGRDPAV